MINSAKLDKLIEKTEDTAIEVIEDRLAILPICGNKDQYPKRGLKIPALWKLNANHAIRMEAIDETYAELTRMQGEEKSLLKSPEEMKAMAALAKAIM